MRFIRFMPLLLFSLILYDLAAYLEFSQGVMLLGRYVAIMLPSEQTLFFSFEDFIVLVGLVSLFLKL